MNSSPDPVRMRISFSRVRADDLEHLAERPVILHGQLDRAAERVRLHEQHAVLAAGHREEILEPLAVLLEPGRWHELL